jgi:hypothetical protein
MPRNRLSCIMRQKPTVVCWTLGLLLLWQVTIQVHSAFSWGHESWQMTEWLINYSGGFVRRGLPGSVFLWISNETAIPANYLVIAVSALCYTLLSAWLLGKATRYFPAVLLLSCLVIGFPAYQDSIIRKDCLLLLLFLACLKCLGLPCGEGWKWAAINLVICTAILVHEAFVFFAIPALLVCRHACPALKPFQRGIAMLPALACFGVATWFHGTPKTAGAIHASWMPLWLKLAPLATGVETPAAAIMGSGWTAAEGMALTRGILQTGIYQPSAWLGTIVISFLLMIRFLRVDSTGNPRTEATSILLFQLAGISPLFILGIDYGRWLFLWMTSSIILITVGSKAPLTLERCLATCRPLSHSDRFIGILPRWNWVFLIFGIPVLWSMRNFLTASPLGRTVDEVLRIRFFH